MTGQQPGTDSSRTYLTYGQKAALSVWKPLAEAVLATDRPCTNEMLFWLHPMGFKFVNGKLTLPSSAWATPTNPWTNIERFWLDWHWYYAGRTNPETDPNRPDSTIFLILSPKPDQSGLRALRSAYPLRTDYFTLINALYSRVKTALQADLDYLTSHVTGFSIDKILAGLVVLFEYFLTFSTAHSLSWGYLRSYIPSNATGRNTFDWVTGTVGPYTIAIYYCENGVIRGIDIHTAHQSVDSDMLLQDITKKQVAAGGLLIDRQDTEVEADVALQAMVPTEIAASMPLRANVPVQTIARMAVRDRVTINADADGLLAETHQFEFESSARLISMPRAPVDADMCIVTPVLHPLAAHMLLLPDTASEMLTELEATHIQKFRIKADPRSYQEFDSRDSSKMGGVVP
jgi:hypothetical protein